MKYKHTVKFNGVYYPAGAEVPVEGKKRAATDGKKETPPTGKEATGGE